jgi:HK97 family phage major capsid protein
VLAPDELIDLFYAVKTTYGRRGAWAANRGVIGTMRKMKDGEGRYLWTDNFQEGQPSLFLGKPVVEVPALPDIGANAVPVVFGDWSRGVRFFDRVNMVILPDRFTRAANGQVRYHARRRFGFKLTRPEALVGLKMPAV